MTIVNDKRMRVELQYGQYGEQIKELLEARPPDECFLQVLMKNVLVLRAPGVGCARRTKSNNYFSLK